MKRRDFLKVATGAAGGAAAVGTTSASSGSSLSNQEGTTTTGDGSGGGGTQTTGGGGTQTTDGGGGTQTTGGGGGGGGTETVEVGPNGEFVFTPGTNEPLSITPGTTVEFVWKSNDHNIVVESQPEGANWEGHEPIEDSGFTYSHTFETEGAYEYFCEPHKSAGMTGTVEVTQDGGGSAPVKQDPHEMGVPFQAHFVGIATILMMFVSLVYTFFVLKYGESRHASAPNKR